MNCNACRKFLKTFSSNSFLLYVTMLYGILFSLYSLYVSLFLFVLACSRMCQNGGTLDPGNCSCICAGGFSGANSESDCIMEYMCELIKLAENVLVSQCKLINARTKLKKRFCIALSVLGSCLVY